MQCRVQRVAGVVFEDTADRSPDRHLLPRVTQQVAHQAQAAGLGQLHHHGQVGAMVLQRRVHRVPHALPAVDAPAWRNLDPGRVERQAGMAQPLGAELPGRAVAAALKTDALELLIEALADPFWRVRHAAVQALAALGEEDLEVRERVRLATPLQHKRSAQKESAASPVASSVAYLECVWNDNPVDDALLADPGLATVPFIPSAFADEDPAVVTARLERALDADVPSRALVVWLGNPHAALRTLARKKLRDRNDFEALVDALHWFDEPRIPHAAEEVHAICDRLGANDLDLARRVLEGRVSSGTLMWAAEVASMRGCETSMDRVRTLAREGEPELRRAAIRGLVRDERSLDIVLGALDDDDPHVRAAALAAWEARPRAGHIVDAWIEALLAFAPRASTVRERRAVVEAAALGGDEALLKRALDDADPSVVATALSSLGAMQALTPAERLRALQHDDPWIRGAALNLDAAVRTAMNEVDPWVCRAATDLVVRNRTNVSPNELRVFGLAGALHPDAWVRARVAELLDPRHRDELRALLRLSGDTSPMVRAAAATMLESAEDLDERIAALIDARDADDVVRKSAFTWLVRRGDDAAFQHLIAALERGGEQPDVAQHLEALSLVFPDQSFDKVPHLHERRPMAVVGEAPAKQRRSDNRRASAMRSLGQTGLRLSPLVLSGAHGLPVAACAEAYDAGIRSFFWEPKYREMSKFLRSRRLARDSFTVIAGTYFAGADGIRADVERTLKQLRFDWIDVFLLFWVRSSARIHAEEFAALEALRKEGKVRTFGFSTHDRTICVNALQSAAWPVVMTRHSAAHPGAEEKVFPTAIAQGTGILTFTATCYGRLLRPTAGGGLALPTAADCYRYSLAQAGVSACLTAPRNRDELFENLEVLDGEKLDGDAMAAIRAHGVAVRAENRRFDTLVRRAPGGPHDRLRELLDEG